MNLGLLALIIGALAAYLMARTWVSSDVFEAPRSKLFDWLLKGQSKRATRIGDIIIKVAAGLAVTGVITAFVGRIDTTNQMAAVYLGAALLLLLTGEFIGHRFFVQDGLDCRLCMSVWTSAMVTASLSAWGHWPIVPSFAFGLAMAGAASLLSFTEGLIATVTEGIDLDNKRKKAAIIAELAADPDTADADAD